jgi:hypothetical protein
MINKYFIFSHYFKTKKCVDALIFKKFDAIQLLSLPSNEIAIYSSLTGAIQFMSLALAQLLISFSLQSI